MAELTVEQYTAKYATNNPAALFVDNITGRINEAALRTFAQDTLDTFLIKASAQDLPEATTDQMGLVRLASLTAENTVLNSQYVITAQVLNQVLFLLRTGKENVGVAAGLVNNLRGNVSSSRDTLEKISAAIDGLQAVEREVNFYQDLAGLPAKVNGENVFVKNAFTDAPTAGAGDPTILTANTWAIYKYILASDSWAKISEKEALDVDFTVFLRSATADADADYAPTTPADVTALGLPLVAGKIKFRAFFDKLASLVKLIKTGGSTGKFLSEAGDYRELPPPDLSGYYEKTITYTQAEVNELLGNKVDKVAGKQLSAEDFTALLKAQLLANTSDNAVNSRYEGKLDAIQQGANIAVDNTDPLSPKISAVGLVKTVNYVSPGADGNVSLPQTGAGVSDARVATYAAMLTGSWQDGQNIFVEDAAGDPTVEAGSAYYKYRTAGNQFTKLSEAESMDLAFSGFTRDASGENTLDYTPSDPDFFDGLLTGGKLKDKAAKDRITSQVKRVFPAGDGSQYWANDGTFKTVSSFTEQQVRDTPLTGLGALTGLPTASDKIIVAWGKALNFFNTIGATVRNTQLSGVDVNASGTVGTSDSIEQAVGKLQRQATSNTANINAFYPSITFPAVTQVRVGYARKFSITSTPVLFNVAAVTFRVNSGTVRTTIADANADIAAVVGSSFTVDYTITFATNQSQGQVALSCQYL